MRRAAALLAPAVLAALLAGAGCGGGVGGDEHRSILVFAAASLTDAFTAIGDAFTATHPGTDVAFNFAGSSALAQQLDAGAPADVFAPADDATMATVAGAVGPVTFARNQLEIAVPPGNPAGVHGLADFGTERLLLGLCAPAVPCGKLAREALDRAGVAPSLDTEEPDVRSLLTKVASGDLDGGIVYVTDVRAAGSTVEGIPIPPAANVATAYPIAVLASSGQPDLSRAFVEFVLGADAQAILAGAGFLPPA